MKKVKSRRAPPKATRQPKAVAKRARKSVKGGSRNAVLTSRGKSVKPGTRKGAKGAGPAKPELQIRELDPLRICGDRTSVIQLFRVDEQLVGGKAAGARQVHLVFNDRHGWYCEHGRSCHAVSAVMRHARIR